MPLEPIAAILEAFRTHDVVALGEGRHNNEPGYAFRLALIRDPRFAATVNDIVVESGSSTHQDAMDRFIRGEAVSDKELRLAWQDTTAPDDVWDVPMYEEFFRAVRIVNASLPPERKLRVLLGDPPFDWEHATREEAIRIGLRRDPFCCGINPTRGAVEAAPCARHLRRRALRPQAHRRRLESGHAAPWERAC